MDYNTMILVALICGCNLLCYLMGAKYSSRVKIIRITSSEKIDIIPIDPEIYNKNKSIIYPDETPEALSNEDEMYYDTLKRKTILKHGGDITDV